MQQGARRENILYGSLTDEQRRCSGKDPATLRAKLWRAAGGVAPQTERCGYAPSSRLASRPPELSALILYL